MECNVRYTVSVDVAVPMRDGVTLATDIWVPESDGPLPVLMVRTPTASGAGRADLAPSRMRPEFAESSPRGSGVGRWSVGVLRSCQAVGRLSAPGPGSDRTSGRSRAEPDPARRRRRAMAGPARENRSPTSRACPRAITAPACTLCGPTRVPNAARPRRTKELDHYYCGMPVAAMLVSPASTVLANPQADTWVAVVVRRDCVLHSTSHDMPMSPMSTLV